MNRPVNTVPLPVSTSPGTPQTAIASAKARQTGRAVARMTALAMTQYREWSSSPVTIFTSVPAARNALAVTSSCHSCTGTGRSHRV